MSNILKIYKKYMLRIYKKDAKLEKKTEKTAKIADFENNKKY